MGSRLKLNPEQTFYWFFEASCPVARDKDPGMLFQFPEDFNDEESCETLPRFCFPYDVHKARDGVAVQHFTFVLTDLKGFRRFGFCRLANSTHTCLCILSYLPWFEVFYKLLNNLADYLSKGQTNEMKALLTALYKQPLPLAAGSVTLQMGEQLLVSTEVSPPVGHLEGQEGVPYFIAPDPRSLPSIPENRNLTELIVAVDVGNLLQLYASMLFERRILFFASKLSTLTSCVHALSAVLYPMYWQHIFIPVMPPHLLDYCCAPMPYLIGVHTSLSERVRSLGLEEVVILNVDTNTLETPFDDLKRIPSDVMSGLKVCLKRQAVSPGCGISRAFMKAQALLFGGYRDGLQVQDGEIRFCEKTFLDNKPHSTKQFLQNAVHLQFFKQFIDGRLDILNAGEEPADLFEEEILKCDSTEGKIKSYQQLVGNLKKGGGALILNMKTKANMRAKGLSRSGLKRMLLHKANSEDHDLQRGGSVTHRRAQSDCLQDRLPITQHFGKSRPRRPLHKSRAPGDDDTIDTGEAQDGATNARAEPDPEFQGDEEEDEGSLMCDPEEMDLLGEIFDSLSSRSSYDRGLLYGTRSLDLFGPDSHDFITKHGTTNPSQESLSLSISGSGSLHSWNVETTEELSDLTEDSDWGTRGPDGGETDNAQAVREVEEREKGQKEDGEKREGLETELNCSRRDRAEITNHFLRETIEEEQKTELKETLGTSVDDCMSKTMEKQEDEGLKDKGENDGDNGVTAGRETERHADEVQKKVAEVERRETRESEEEESSLDPKLLKSVEEQREQTPPSEPRRVASEPDSAAGGGQSKEEMAREEGREVRQTPPPPKVQSAKARFQTEEPCQGVPLTSRSKAWTDPGRPHDAFVSREAAQSHPPPEPETNSRSEVSEEENVRSAIKVSELKKRFEA